MGSGHWQFRVDCRPSQPGRARVADEAVNLVLLNFCLFSSLFCFVFWRNSYLQETNHGIFHLSIRIATFQNPSAGTTSKSCGCRCSLVVSVSKGHQWAMRNRLQVIGMAPEEEKLTRRNPLDFPIEWERPKPGRRPDIFPQFSPMKTPLPPPMPYDPPEEDEE
ncbi:putative glutamate carboxypeptidase 2-like [Hibiscus syriacus]|uniref:Glutamate carboxypeptidase 2-like n=1 Tax=Hibiscus syriacus TaxID=106335 RepID=A0A6A3ARE7_HIBSY|nr:putative glutamate carboxypeptidase 2-like [Hibiscus syriacus]